ncbi:hypothetical protein GGI42DRAFT_91306 [Trichoderma sp. SZMC 28013]
MAVSFVSACLIRRETSPSITRKSTIYPTTPPPRLRHRLATRQSLSPMSSFGLTHLFGGLVWAPCRRPEARHDVPEFIRGDFFRPQQPYYCDASSLGEKLASRVQHKPGWTASLTVLPHPMESTEPHTNRALPVVHELLCLLVHGVPRDLDSIRTIAA